jgi:hypothetical protein
MFAVVLGILSLETAVYTRGLARKRRHLVVCRPGCLFAQQSIGGPPIWKRATPVAWIVPLLSKRGAEVSTALLLRTDRQFSQKGEAKWGSFS